MGRDVEEDLSAADLRALVDSARALAEETNLDRLPNIILERAADLTDSRDASVLLYRPDLHGLSFVAEEEGYFTDEGLTLGEIGGILGITESRVCQIHTKAVIQLRSKLGDPTVSSKR